MKVLDWQELTLDPGILREPAAEGGRIVLWLPGEQNGAFQHWEAHRQRGPRGG